MSQILYTLDDKDLAFPDHEHALSQPNGLLAVGGDLSVPRLVSAYSKGIFPWFSEHDPILWWSPEPRAIIHLNDLRINRTLHKYLQKSPYHVTINKNFKAVINHCANAPFRNDDTWIVDDMVNAYIELHKQGFAHSIEVWHDKTLVGGLYGVALGGYFSGESMFYSQTNASKVALVALAKLLQQLGITFIDCQLQNPFLESMGAIEISRKSFIKRQQQEIKRHVCNTNWHTRDIPFR